MLAALIAVVVFAAFFVYNLVLAGREVGRPDTHFLVLIGIGFLVVGSGAWVYDALRGQVQAEMGFRPVLQYTMLTAILHWLVHR